MPSPVAVIDVGSNTIKLLVAARAADGSVKSLFFRTCDARISRGISADKPKLGEEGMQLGLEAISSLLADARAHAPAVISMVATSAVRSASNGPEFAARVREATGQELRILSGEEEARGIGRGLASDPALATLGRFYVFDLGGGSMECLSFDKGERRQGLSLPLGCVRLTERFITDPSAPIPSAQIEAISRHSAELLANSGFRFDLAGAGAVFAGGSMTSARAIVGAEQGKLLEDSPLEISLDQLSNLLTRLAAMSLEERRRSVPGLPPARADVFPAALATMLAAGRAAGASSFRHSLYNLRHGIAAELLARA